MKKMIFSAIAMMAFVGTSMANDIAEKEVVSVDIKEIEIADSKEQNTLFIFLTKCDIIFLKTLVIAKEQDLTDADAGKVAHAAFQACVEVVDGQK